MLTAKSYSWVGPLLPIRTTWVTSGIARASPAAIAPPSDTPITSTRVGSTSGRVRAWRTAFLRVASQAS